MKKTLEIRLLDEMTWVFKKPLMTYFDMQVMEMTSAN